jgi:hypothetical protein
MKLRYDSDKKKRIRDLCEKEKKISMICANGHLHSLKLESLGTGRLLCCFLCHLLFKQKYFVFEEDPATLPNLILPLQPLIIPGFSIFNC